MGSAWLRGGVTGAGVGLLGALLSLTPPVLELEEAAGLDWLFRQRTPLPPPENVAIIGISADSADEFGVSSDLDEWPRSLHANLIDRLAEAGAAVIAFDLIFDQPSGGGHDARLAQAVRDAGNVVLLERVRSEPPDAAADRSVQVVLERRIRPIEPLAQAAIATAPFTLPTVPIRVSQFWTFGRAGSDVPTLPAVLLQLYAAPVYEPFAELVCRSEPAACDAMAPGRSGLFQESLQRGMQLVRGVFRAHAGLADELRAALTRTQLPARERDLMMALVELYDGPRSRWLNYYGSAGTVTTIPFHEVLRVPSILAEHDVAGKVVLVGVSERRQPEQQDDFYSVFSERSGQNLSGVEIGATALANLLQRDSVVPLPISRHLLYVFSWGLALGLLLYRLPVLAAVAAAFAVSAGYAWFAAERFAAAAVWWPLVVPVLVQVPALLVVTLLLRYRDVQAQRERVQSALGGYVPAPVARRLARESLAGGARPEVLHGACLVADVEQYTRRAESMSPSDLGTLMNEYYEVLCTTAERHDGLVADVSADSMVAIWAAAKPNAESHAAACRAALQLRIDVARFNEYRAAEGLTTGFGIDSGELLLGNIGAAGRHEYRAVGDIVNTASRIQGLNRQLGTQVLVSAATAAAVPDLPTRPLGRFLFLGKRRSVAVHELLAVGGSGDDGGGWLVAAFSEVLDDYETGRFAAAEASLLSILERLPEDGPSHFYLKECRRWLAQATPAGWDGVIRMTTK